MVHATKVQMCGTGTFYVSMFGHDIVIEMFVAINDICIHCINYKHAVPIQYHISIYMYLFIVYMFPILSDILGPSWTNDAHGYMIFFMFLTSLKWLL